MVKQTNTRTLNLTPAKFFTWNYTVCLTVMYVVLTKWLLSQKYWNRCVIYEKWLFDQIVWMGKLEKAIFFLWGGEREVLECKFILHFMSYDAALCLCTESRVRYIIAGFIFSVNSRNVYHSPLEISSYCWWCFLFGKWSG